MSNENQVGTSFTGIYNFKDFMSLSLEKPKPAVAGLLFEGQTTMLAGRFAVGKTLLTTQMAVHLAAGKEFLGRKVDHPYKVAFIDCENGPSEIQSRWQKQIEGAKLSPEERILVNTNCLYANARDVEASLYGLQLERGKTGHLEEFLTSSEPELVIVDNLGRVIHGDLEKTEDVTSFFKVVQEVKERCPSVKMFLFLHHIKKPSDHGERCTLFQSPYEYLTQMRGSGRLLDFSEGRFALAEEKLSNGTFCVLNGIARSAQVTPIVLERDENSLSFQFVEDKRFLLDTLFSDRPKGRELIDTMMKTRSNQYTFTQLTTLKDNEGKLFNKGTVSSTLALGVANGLIGHENDGTYKIAETLY